MNALGLDGGATTDRSSYYIAATHSNLTNTIAASSVAYTYGSTRLTTTTVSRDDACTYTGSRQVALDKCGRGRG